MSIFMWLGMCWMGDVSVSISTWQPTPRYGLRFFKTLQADICGISLYIPVKSYFALIMMILLLTFTEINFVLTFYLTF